MPILAKPTKNFGKKVVGKVGKKLLTGKSYWQNLRKNPTGKGPSEVVYNFRRRGGEGCRRIGCRATTADDESGVRAKPTEGTFVIDSGCYKDMQAVAKELTRDWSLLDKTKTSNAF